MKYVTNLDADSIVDMRDNRGYTWEVISLLMGYSTSTCQHHYNKRKYDNHKYFGDFLPYLKEYEFKSDNTIHHVTEAYELAKSLGLKMSKRQFRLNLIKHRIPIGNIATNLRMEELQQLINTANEPLDSLVNKVFHDYSYQRRRSLIRKLSK
ncbi:hypothetical protein AVV30_gp046 [Vibrio phage phi 1]|uniref:Uncharacterized protein n=1 Tax=Vibrio phage phi 1 TaxID=1589297 RepID=A0A0B5HAF6_9CAUD|nr:hypothetical protein AVV30_gp046 [Vibrio phage phi 1]AJF40704.1 hypothetical protein SBVP1_0046 [Vibrio phage phi 1]